ncbi:MAG: cytochrome c [Bacteroidetes bacterium]|nr:cytochrome c [Bacteroidota bacterium]MDA1121035.1 cytochrome c [Bacteroidota bacterium]
MKSLSYSFLFVVLSFFSCGSQGTGESSGSNEKTKSETPISVVNQDFMANKGIGPVKSLTLGALDEAIAAEGKTLFDGYCVACHNPTEKLIGPAPKGILERRSPEWIMNMILNPMEMTEKDPVAKKQLEEANGVPMISMGLTEEQARKILEYFRTL